MTIEEEFFRALSPSTGRASRWALGNAVHLGTDIGLRREENEDRVAVISWTDGDEGQDAYVAIAVVDGMGGMLDGARCAAITVAAYFNGLIAATSESLSDRVERAAHLANRRVHDSYRGQGGATLSSLIVSNKYAPITLNIGDSRIYGLLDAPNARSLLRLSVDDTFKEAFESDGEGLIQFVGLGRGIRPHVHELPPSIDEVVITTDGAHYVDKDLFSKILTLAPDIKSKSDRAIALARWLGGHDNITVATVDIGKCLFQLESQAGRAIALSTATSDASFLLIQNSEKWRDASVKESAASPPLKAIKSRAKKKAASKKVEKPQHEQLAIDIEVSSRKDTDANS